MNTPTLTVGQRVRVKPNSGLPTELHGVTGTVDSINADAGCVYPITIMYHAIPEGQHRLFRCFNSYRPEELETI